MGGTFAKSVPENTNLETFSLIWLDAQVNTLPDNLQGQEQLRTSINHLQTFDKEDLCEEYIRSLTENDRIVLISSGGLGEEIVPRIHQLRQIFSIYIYCINREKHEQWAKDFIKVQGVFTNLGKLIERLLSDQDRQKHNKVDEQLSISIFNTKDFERQWKNESNDHFIYSQVLIDCLLQMPITSTEKTALISLCKIQSKSNKVELNAISNFERKYSSQQAIQWYTSESFLYQMLTKALRIQNTDLLFLFRYVIRDIQLQLEENKCSSTLNVYRSQLMSTNEVQMLQDSLEKFISINSFLSAILDRKAALLLLTNAKVPDDIERVLFEIHADGHLNGVKAFNNITSKSFYHQEEILFSIGSIFQLTDIRLSEENIWIIQMALCTNNHPQLAPIFEYIEEEYGNTKTSLLTFGLVLQKMNKFDEAEKYYQRLIQVLPAKHGHRVHCHAVIDKIFIDKENYTLALQSMSKSMEIHMETSKMSDYHLAFNHSNTGEQRRKHKDFKGAFESYEKALSIWQKCFNDDHQEVGRCYKSMGLIHQENNEYEQALESYEKAKNILEKHLPSNHPDLSAIYSNIGDMHQSLNHYDEALINYIISLKSAEQALTPQVSLIISLSNKIASVCEQKKDFQQALDYYEKIASLSPSTHADAVKNKANIQRVSCQLK